MTVSLDDVRDYLNNMTTYRIPDDTITLHLRLATSFCERWCRESASQAQKDDAILTRCAWQSYIAYTVELERAAGGLPPPVLTQLGQVEAMAIDALAICGGGGQRQAGPTVSIMKTVVPKEYEELAQGAE